MMEEKLGAITIAPNVLITIVQKTTTSVPGVDRLLDNVPGMKRLLGLHSAGQGVAVRVEDDEVAVDVYLVARRNVELLQMGRHVQRDITRAIHEIVGKNVREVNVHIEDVATELPGDVATPKG